MMVARQEFRDTQQEVNIYFDLLKKIEIGYDSLQNLQGDSVRISTESKSILKANAYLLLYNLVEATIRNSIWEIFISISNESVDYKDLNVEIKRILIDGKINLDFKTKDETIVKQVYDMIDKVFRNAPDLYPEKRNLKISAGSLNVLKIQDTLKRHGIRPVNVNSEKQKLAFETLKNGRNDLAHGSLTFMACGSPLAYADLEKMKDYVYEYLVRVITQIEIYIENQQYKNP